MSTTGRPEWVVREDAGTTVIVALYVRQALGLRAPEELPHLRRAPAAPVRADDEAGRMLERQWLAYWAMTVEPQAHPATGPLDLVDGFGGLAALPLEGADELRAAMAGWGPDAVAYARAAAERYAAQLGPGAASYRAYAGAIAEHERRIGRRAHSFELNVQVLPLTQRGIWWIGALTVAVTDGLRSDVAAFDTAIAPIIADLA
jgi:hypothetical protein